MKRVGVLAAVLLLLLSASSAQQSTDFKLEEYTLNAGGTPSQGTELVSASFRLTVTSAGDTLLAVGLNSLSFRLDSGFEAAYLPPGEVGESCGTLSEGCLQFTDAQTLTWPAERSAGTYNLYRDNIDFGYGVCEQQDLNAPEAVDSSVPLTGSAFYYLVTVENRLAEEGTKGFQSDDIERQGATDLAVCP